VARIVASLKEFSHPNNAHSTTADLNRVIETAVNVSRHEWKYVAEIVCDFAADLPTVPCVVDEFNQVMLNLIVNAAHAIGDAVKARNDGNERGTITIRTRREGEHFVIVEVADTGTGIAEAHRARIFEPFFTTKEVGRGTGQGLTIVHRVITKRHHGTVSFETEVGRGTTFRLRLPLTGRTCLEEISEIPPAP
jgi:signal transduction histidine kinase